MKSKTEASDFKVDLSRGLPKSPSEPLDLYEREQMRWEALRRKYEAKRAFRHAIAEPVR